MPQEDQSAKTDIVSSIFNRAPKKRVSSLFSQKGQKPAVSSAPQQTITVSSAIKRIFPFGLDIATSAVKIAQLGVDENGALKTAALIYEPLPPEIQDDPKERNPFIKDKLRRIMTEHGLKKECFVAAPPGLMKTNLVKLPQMPQPEIEKALRWKLRQIAQAEPQEISYDYLVLERQKFLSNQIGVLAVASLKKDMFEYLAFLNSCGLNVLAIDIEPLADLAVLEYAKMLQPEETVVYLDIGAGKTMLNIISSREPVYLRPLNISGNSLTKAVAAYCNTGRPEAEAAKKESGISERKMECRNAMLPLIENMVQDIEHTFKYFSFNVARSVVTKFDRVVLSGGSSRMENLAAFLGSRLNTKAELLNAAEIFDTPDLKDKDKLIDLGPQMNVAFGLALRGAE